jgi:hypothetical protein
MSSPTALDAASRDTAMNEGKPWRRKKKAEAEKSAPDHETKGDKSVTGAKRGEPAPDRSEQRRKRLYG